MSNHNVWLVVALLLTCGLWWVLTIFVSDLMFYQRKGWDFNIDNPKAYYVGHGDESASIRMTNKARIFFALPMFLLVLRILVISVAYTALVNL